MEKILVLASSNKDKMQEIEAIFQGLNFTIKRAIDMGEEIEIVEDQDTFEGNAILKARAYHALYPEHYILADDSGLAIDALDGHPGVYSARYGGEGADYLTKSRMLWDALRATGVPEEEWFAQFVCAVCFWMPGESEPMVFNGEMEGRIIPEQRGEHGFGYDPIFYLDSYGKTSAEIDPEEKNKISHRGLALAKLREYLE